MIRILHPITIFTVFPFRKLYDLYINQKYFTSTQFNVFIFWRENKYHKIFKVNSISSAFLRWSLLTKGYVNSFRYVRNEFISYMEIYFIFLLEIQYKDKIYPKTYSISEELALSWTYYFLNIFNPPFYLKTF